jgi:hypothetical protein
MPADEGFRRICGAKHHWTLKQKQVLLAGGGRAHEWNLDEEAIPERPSDELLHYSNRGLKSG